MIPPIINQAVANNAPRTASDITNIVPITMPISVIIMTRPTMISTLIIISDIPSPNKYCPTSRPIASVKSHEPASRPHALMNLTTQNGH